MGLKINIIITSMFIIPTLALSQTDENRNNDDILQSANYCFTTTFNIGSESRHWSTLVTCDGNTLNLEDSLFNTAVNNSIRMGGDDQKSISTSRAAEWLNERGFALMSCNNIVLGTKVEFNCTYYKKKEEEKEQNENISSHTEPNSPSK